jgi:hypothetical protein
MRKTRERSAKFVQVLEYMDGPQAVLLERSADQKIVAVAIQKAGFSYPFFGAQISSDQWERYRRGFVDLRYLFMYPRGKKWYFFDLANQQDGILSLEPVKKDEYIEKHYIPEIGFFSYDHSEPIKEEKSRDLATQRYKPDGIWDLPDFAHFYKKLTDLYAFFCR